MTVPAQDTRVTYTASGSSDTFAYPFRILNANHLLVQVDGVTATDYTLTGVDNEDGGNVVFDVAPTAGAEIVIMRDMDYGRTEYDYQQAGELRALTLNKDIDSLAMQIQQLAEKISRAPLLAITTALTGLQFPNLEALKYLRANSTASGLEWVDTVVSSGTFLQSGTGAVERTANAKMAESVSTKDFDAAGDRSADDTICIQNAVNACLSYNTPLVNGQGLIPTLDVVGMSRLTASIMIDRAEGGQTGFFRIVGKGVGAGFLVTSGITMFDTNYAGDTELTKSTMISFESLIFQGPESVESFVAALGKFTRVKFDNCVYRQVQLCNASGAGTDYIQSVSLNRCSIREARGDFITAVNAYDLDISHSPSIESNAGDIVKISTRVAGGRFIGNLVQSNGGGFLDIHTCEGVVALGNYAENNIGAFWLSTNVAGSCGFGNIIDSRTDNMANSNFWEFDFTEVTGFQGGGNHTDGRLYACRGTSRNMNVGQGDNAGIALRNRDFVDLRYGQQNINVIDLQEAIGTYGNRFTVHDFRTTASGTTPFLEVSCGTEACAMVLRVCASGLRPGDDYIAIIKEFYCTRTNGGAFTITEKQAQAAAGGTSITCTESSNKIRLNYVFAGSSTNTFNATVEILAVAGNSARSAISAAQV